MKYRKTVIVLSDRDKRKSSKANIRGHRRISIPVEIRDFIEVNKGDFIEWEVDTIKKTLKGKLIKNKFKKIVRRQKKK